MNTTTQAISKLMTAIDRNDANALRIYRLCAARTCRRAQACRGDPTGCLERYLKLVPRAAVMLLVGLKDLLEEGVPLEQALAQLEEQEEGFGAWLQVLDLIDGKPGGRWLLAEPQKIGTERTALLKDEIARWAGATLKDARR